MRGRLILVVLSAVVLCGVTWLVAVRSVSPQQVAARGVPATPMPVRVPLRSGFLDPPISMSMETTWERRSTVVSAFDEESVITHVEHAPGDEVLHGDQLARANGRPILMLAMPFPLYRDLTGGETGDDVSVLQGALEQAGHPTGSDVTGYFGSGTKAALASLYEAVGAQAPEDDARIRNELADLEAQYQEQPSQRLQDEYSALERTLGPQMLRREIVRVGSLPAHLMTVVPVGAVIEPGGELATLGGGDVVATATVPSESVTTLRPGAEAMIEPEGIDALVGEVIGVDSVEDGNHRITVRPKRPIDAGVRLLVRVENPSGESEEQVLAPAAAIVSRGGRSYVYLLDGSGYREIEVQVGGTNGGTAAVTAVGDDPLVVGEEVRIGGT